MKKLVAVLLAAVLIILAFPLLDDTILSQVFKPAIVLEKWTVVTDPVVMAYPEPVIIQPAYPAPATYQESYPYPPPMITQPAYPYPAPVQVTPTPYPPAPTPTRSFPRKR